MITSTVSWMLNGHVICILRCEVWTVIRAANAHVDEKRLCLKTVLHFKDSDVDEACLSASLLRCFFSLSPPSPQPDLQATNCVAAPF